MGVIYFIWRQMTPRKVRRVDLFIIPIVAAIKAYKTMPYDLSWNIQGEALALFILSLAIGIWQGGATRVYNKDGFIYIKGGAQYLIAWVCLIVGRVLITVVCEGGINFSSGWLMWACIGITWGVRSAILYLRHPEIGTVLNKKI
ncbi:hypothetical protein [Bacillus thuringiensis]|uniref:hypothetical protein n=1 Tax=Bacillus thuringiensis TaxID=1428 RepID=UPI00156D79FB|nr:hypothetical protein [Bacillus thuringiensis]